MPSKKHFQSGVERIVGPSWLATQLMDTVEYTCTDRQTRPRSACTSVQADLGLFCLCILKGPFSCGAHHMQCNFVIGICAATSDNIPLDMFAQQRFRSACAFMRSESSLSVFWIAKDAKLITWEQQRLIKLSECRGWFVCIGTSVRVYVFYIAAQFVMCLWSLFLIEWLIL